MANTAGNEAAGRRLGNYQLHRTLGKGMSGKVKLGVDLRTGETVAVKIMYKDNMSARAAQQLRREITSMKALDHPNVLRLKDVHESLTYVKKNGLEKEVVILVLELAVGGELFDFMMYTGAFPEVIARTYFCQMLSALEMCHSTGIAHRDIKPENILLDNNFQLRMADFGLSSIMEDENGVCYTECGTRSYMAPEVLAKQPYDGAQADLWSAGVVLFIMLAGNPPFQMAVSTDWWFRAVSSGRHDRFWAAHLRGCPDFPPLAQAFLNRIFVADPLQRATLEELKSHEWLAGGTLPAHTLYDELLQRKRRVDDRKAAERQAHVQRREEEAARQGRGHVDPFPLNVQRSVSKPGEVDQSRLQAPNVPTDLHGMHVFYSAAALDMLLDKLRSALAGMAGTPHVTLKPQSAKVKAVFPGDGLEMVAQVYSNPNLGCHVVELTRRAGDAFTFNEIREILAKDLGSMISGAADVKAIASKDAFDEDPEVMSFPMAIPGRQPEHCASAQKRAGEEKLAERLEDVDVI
ncbi:unnamed protein product [Ectocarpus sp. 4 AP-2014]